MTLKSKQKLISIVCCACALALTVLSCLGTYGRLRRATRTALTEQLEDTANYSSHYIRMYFKSLMTAISDMAPLMAGDNDLLGDSIRKALGEILPQTDAEELAVTRADGEYATARGARGNWDFSKLISDGKGGISISNGVDGAGCRILISAPITRDGALAGALTGIYDIAKLSETFCGEYFSDAGCFHIFRQNGEHLLSFLATTSLNAVDDDSVNDISALTGDAKFSALMGNVNSGKSGIIDYKATDGEQMTGYYTPLGINDWYIIFVAPSIIGWQSERDYGELLLELAIVLLAIYALLVAALIYMHTRSQRQAARESARLEKIADMQRMALSTLGAPAFAFDIGALEARALDAENMANAWLMERILIPERAGELVDPRDESAYLKLCDSIMSAKGMLSGDFRLRLTPDAPLRMYRLTLSVPRQLDAAQYTLVTLVDLEDVARRMEALRVRAAVDEITGMDTFSEFKLKAERLLERQLHRAGAVAVILADNIDCVCDGAPELDHRRIIGESGKLVREAFAECDVLARNIGCEFWVFSGDQTASEIINKGMNSVLDSKIGAPGVTLTFSCAVARTDSEAIDSLVARAQEAVRAAHREGGHRLQHG